MTSLKGCFRTSYYGQFIIIYSCANIVLQFKQFFSLPAVLFSSPAPFPTPTSKFVENNQAFLSHFLAGQTWHVPHLLSKAQQPHSPGTSHSCCRHLFWREFLPHTGESKVAHSWERNIFYWSFSNPALGNVGSNLVPPASSPKVTKILSDNPVLVWTEDASQPWVTNKYFLNAPTFFCWGGYWKQKDQFQEYLRTCTGNFPSLQ